MSYVARLFVRLSPRPSLTMLNQGKIPRANAGHITRNLTAGTDAGSTISPAARDILNTRKRMDVLDSFMEYLDTAKGSNVVIFLHGNPTSSFLWRNVIPHVQPVARCLAPDLIGMGGSGKPDIGYTYVEHYSYLSKWIDQMDLPSKISIVGHDWGSALGFNWCYQNQDRVQSIIHMESVVRPFPSYDAIPEPGRDMFKSVGLPDIGEELLVKQNVFVEQVVPGNIMRKLSEEEMEAYRKPFLVEKHRLPILVWRREFPIAGEGPEEVHKIVSDYYQWLSTSNNIPKLYIDADPGALGQSERLTNENFPNQKIVKVKGLHFLQEDSPDDIGMAIAAFLKDVYTGK